MWYSPPPFEETRLPVLHELIRRHPFGALVVVAGAELAAVHIPFLLHPGPGGLGTLHGHVARANPVWKHFGGAAEALAIFQGPEAYITPSWYPGKQTDGRVVPTWNYAIVHVHGSPRAITEPSWLEEHVSQLSAAQEAGQPQPWQVSDAPPEYIARLIHGIVGIEIPISKIEGKWKLSQNHSRADQLAVAAGLESKGTEDARAMAELMRQRMKKP